MSTHQSLPKPANAKKKSDILPIPAQSKSHPVVAQPKIESTRSNEEQLAQMRANREASERMGSTLLIPESVPHTPPPVQPKLTRGQENDHNRQEADIQPQAAPIQSHPVIAQPKIESTRSNEEQLAQMRANREASERLGTTLLTPESVARTRSQVQPKLTIGQPNDQYEQEADRVARQVVDQINAPPKIQAKTQRYPMSVAPRKPSPLAHHPVSRVQRQATGGETDAPAARPNKTGLPDALKAGVENISGYSLDDVRVHYNSPQPAQLQALAYTQGTEIQVAPGQEEHLPHEAWHVVQQMQGRVKPTMQMKGVQINNDEGLEMEADVMGHQVNKAELNNEMQDLFIEASRPKQIVQTSRTIQCNVDDLTKWREDIWKSVQKELKNSVLAIEESIDDRRIEDTEDKDPGGFLVDKYEYENTNGGMDISNEDRFKDEEKGGINTVGLRKQLDALSDGVRGRTYEIKFAKKQAVDNQYWMQVGAINGRGGDLSVRAGHKWDDERTYQFKSSRSAEQGSIDTVIKKAAEQLRGEHGENPYQEDTRIIMVEIANANNFFPGTPTVPARNNKVNFSAQFQNRLGVIHAGNGGGKLNGVDKVVIEYTTPVPLLDGTVVSAIEQNLDGNGVCQGIPTIT